MAGSDDHAEDREALRPKQSADEERLAPLAAPLVPRYADGGYAESEIAARRHWLEERTGAALERVGRSAIPGPSVRGNVENPIGAAQVPLGVAGPLLIRGEHAHGVFYVPLATTEGALVRSYERGAVALTRAGGAVTRVLSGENRVCPSFRFANIEDALAFPERVAALLPELRAAVAATTRHGRLLAVDCQVVGAEVIASFRYDTGDAQGMNLATRATDAACRLLLERGLARDFLIFSGFDSEKRASGAALAGGKGKRVVAWARLPRRVVAAVLRTTPEAIAETWRRTVVGNLQAGALGYCGQYANGLAALFIACGQDVANVVNSTMGITVLAVGEDGALEASVTLSSLTVATVGGGTAVGTAPECLSMLDCAGAGKARKLAEIVAATLLAGELSMGAAIATGELVAAHEQYGRNRPPEDRGAAG
ncbi:MAG: hydroxymethylglutaryl-CoA reductase [Acidobacteriota bacterium]